MTRYTTVIASPASQWIAWIERYVASQPHRFVRGKCKEAVEQMHQDFPELRKACGFVHWAIPSRPIQDQHWWCVSPEGIVVDPTAEQFRHSVSEPRYEELDMNSVEDRARIPIGKCMGCGEATYPTSPAHNFCSELCADAVMEEYE
jgi:hypothetical protein